MNATHAAVALLGEIVALGESVVCRPSGDLAARIKCCAELDGRLERAIVGSTAGPSRFLNNFAPIFLDAVGNALKHRAVYDDDAAGDWESLAGYLLPKVRADGRRALKWLAEISRDERPNR